VSDHLTPAQKADVLIASGRGFTEADRDQLIHQFGGTDSRYDDLADPWEDIEWSKSERGEYGERLPRYVNADYGTDF
jgi:hypothetical protein